MLLRFCLVMLLAAFLPSAHADTLIVDNNHPGASDENPGVADRPLKTINRAARLAKAGDTVIIKAGTYRESVRLEYSGTAQAPISFVADPAGSVVVTGADVITGWKKVDGEAPIYRAPWAHQFAIDIRDGKPVEHHPADDPLWGRAEQVIADGRQLLHVLNLADLKKKWKEHSEAPAKGQPSPVLKQPVAGLGGPFEGMFWADTAGKYLYLWLSDGSDPSQRRVEAATRGQIFGVNPWESERGVENVHVRGLIFRCGATFPQRAAVWLHGKNNLLEGCLIEQMSGAGVSVGGSMRRCIVRGCGQVGGGAGGSGFVNEECLWEGNCWKPINRGWDAGGFKITDVDGGLFRRCVFRHNGGPGLWLDIDVRNVVITECVFQGNEGSGLFVEISRDITVTRNLAVENALAVGPEGWASSGILIAESMNCVVASNTCVGNKDGITFREQGPRSLKTPDRGELPYHNKGNTVIANVCAFNRGYQLGLWYDNAFFGWHPAEKEKYKTEAAYGRYLKTIPGEIYDPTCQSMTIDRNLYYSDKGQSLVLYGVGWRPKHLIFQDLKAFARHTGFDALSRTADPLLQNPKAGNFRFQKSSPAWQSESGWQGAPANVNAWASEFLPAF
ncbi:MAG: right-handed parallel beta-helix repeat-containing protein [Armatimonadetes bacterium]|nr:right-handed parallel beta-helix repeat-containing protein [Armatimonadota bacterium]